MFTDQNNPVKREKNEDAGNGGNNHRNTILEFTR